jgi:ABC-type branched-subunit amino acid transport system ATPase component
MTSAAFSRIDSSTITRSWRGERGVTIFLVEQNARQTLAIADRGYVLAKGRVVASGSSAELRRAREVSEAYFGSSMPDGEP